MCCCVATYALGITTGYDWNILVLLREFSDFTRSLIRRVDSGLFCRNFSLFWVYSDAIVVDSGFLLTPFN